MHGYPARAYLHTCTVVYMMGELIRFLTWVLIKMKYIFNNYEQLQMLPLDLDGMLVNLIVPNVPLSG